MIDTLYQRYANPVEVLRRYRAEDLNGFLNYLNEKIHDEKLFQIWANGISDCTFEEFKERSKKQSAKPKKEELTDDEKLALAARIMKGKYNAR